MVLSSFHASATVREAVTKAVRCGATCMRAGNRAHRGDPYSSHDAFSCDYHADQAQDALQIAWSNCDCGEHPSEGDASGRAAWQAAQAGDPAPLISLLSKRLTSLFYQPVGGGEAPLTQHPARYLNNPRQLIVNDSVDEALMVAFYNGCINGHYPVQIISTGQARYDNDQLTMEVDTVCTADGVRHTGAGDQLPGQVDTVDVDVAAHVLSSACGARGGRSRRNGDTATEARTRQSLQDLTPTQAQARLNRMLQVLRIVDPRRFQGLVAMRLRETGAGRAAAIMTGPEERFLQRTAHRAVRAAAKDQATVLPLILDAAAAGPTRWQQAARDPDQHDELFGLLHERISVLVRHSPSTERDEPRGGGQHGRSRRPERSGPAGAAR